ALTTVALRSDPSRPARKPVRRARACRARAAGGLSARVRINGAGRRSDGRISAAAFRERVRGLQQVPDNFEFLVVAWSEDERRPAPGMRLSPALLVRLLSDLGWKGHVQAPVLLRMQMGELAPGLERLGRSIRALLVEDEGERPRHGDEAVGSVHSLQSE